MLKSYYKLGNRVNSLLGNWEFKILINFLLANFCNTKLPFTRY